jgi:hypothetical protein
MFILALVGLQIVGMRITEESTSLRDRQGLSFLMGLTLFSHEIEALSS